jgi:hypothetical protein
MAKAPFNSKAEIKPAIALTCTINFRMVLVWL